ncbi:DUF1127 domain-containing protein [bacterium]|nr:DUF1127 domain-containing protein [bacterium]
MLKTLHDWIIREQHRQYLLDLPDYLLDDIGLTRDQVVDEARKSFWQKGIF